MHGGQTAVAAALGVGKATITAWVGKYPEFAAAVKQGKIESNGRVLESAFDQAVGYYREVTELVKVRDQHTENGRMITTEHVVEKTYTKYFPPDPRMTQFVLMNRFRSEYQKNPPDEEEKGTIIVQHEVERPHG